MLIGRTRLFSVVLRDLCRDKGDFLHIVLGKINTGKLLLDRGPVIIEDLFPCIGTLGNDIGSIRPGNHALIEVVEAVLIVHPRGAIGIHRSDPV